MFKMRLDRIAVVALLVGVAALAVACGGSSGSGGGGPTQPQPGVTFAEDGSPGTNTVFMTDAPSAGTTTFTLEIRANEMDHVRGFAFDVEYPTNLLSFQDATRGAFLGGDNIVDLLVSERTPGTIVVGITRFGSNRAVVSGSGVIVTLTFTSVGAGSGTIGFENEEAFREFSTFTAADWLGGTVTVTQ